MVVEGSVTGQTDDRAEMPKLMTDGPARNLLREQGYKERDHVYLKNGFRGQKTPSIVLAHSSSEL